MFLICMIFCIFNKFDTFCKKKTFFFFFGTVVFAYIIYYANHILYQIYLFIWLRYYETKHFVFLFVIKISN